MKRYIILLSIMSLTFALSDVLVNACLWPVGRELVGKKIEVEGLSAADFIKTLTTHEDRTYWEKVQTDIEKQQKDHPFMESHNNLAVALIHLGRVKEAIPLLQTAERKSPGIYVTAANLGTAYELVGENQKALEWIKEGINRNRDSHFGTEWLHVKILEAKLAMEKDPEWLKKHSVLGVDFGEAGRNQSSENLPTDHLGQKKSLAEVEATLIYQLHERLEFVKPSEPIVADLLSDLSRVFSLSGKAEHAKVVQELALSYGANSEEIVKRQPADANPIAEQKTVNSYVFYGLLGVIVILIFGSCFFLWKKRKLH